MLCILRTQSLNNLNSCQSLSKKIKKILPMRFPALYLQPKRLNMTLFIRIITHQNGAMYVVIWTVNVIALANAVLKRKQLSRNVCVHGVCRFCGKLIRNRLLLLTMMTMINYHYILLFSRYYISFSNRFEN